MPLATEKILQGRTADVIHTDGEKLDPGESTNEFCVDMRHHVPHRVTLKLQTSPLARNRIIRQVIKNFLGLQFKITFRFMYIMFLPSIKKVRKKSQTIVEFCSRRLIFYRPIILLCMLCFSGLIKSRFLKKLYPPQRLNQL